MLTTYILASLILTGGTFIGAVGGFGGGIFAMSLLIMFMPLQLAAVAFALAALTSSIWLSWTFRKNMPIKAVTPVVFGRAMGVIIGANLLAFESLNIYAKILLTIVIIGMAAKELIRPDKSRDDLPHEIKIPPAMGSGIGLISGIMNGWINMGGPPLILYGYRSFDGKTARRFLITVFFLTFPIQLLGYWYKDLFTVEAFRLYAAMIPGTIIGTVTGHFLQKRIPKEIFIKVVWITLLILGLILGVNTFLGKTRQETGGSNVDKSTSLQEGAESPENKTETPDLPEAGKTERPDTPKRELESQTGEELKKKH